MLTQKTIDTIKSTIPVLEVYGKEITTVFYKNMFAAHPELLNIFNHTNQAKGRQQTALANTVLAAAKYIDQLETIIPVVKQIAHKHRSLAVKAEHYPIVGEFLLKAIKEVLGEAATDEIIQAWADAYGVIAQVFIDMEKEMYAEAAEQTGGWSDYKNFKVLKKEKESDVITSFYLVPEDQATLPPFEPGQYITVRLAIPGEEFLFNRQYSLSDAPGKEYFRISVKREVEREPNGKVSTFIHDHINTGDIIEVTAPAGDFTLDNNEETPIVFISGGVGITPFMSMIQSLSKRQSNREINFIHSARNGTVQAFKDELNRVGDTLSNWNLSFIYENPSEEDKVNPSFKKQGYIDKEWLQNNGLLQDADYYVCGPVPFLQAVIASLSSLGIDSSKVHYEFFGPSVNLDTTVQN